MESYKYVIVGVWFLSLNRSHFFFFLIVGDIRDSTLAVDI